MTSWKFSICSHLQTQFPRVSLCVLPLHCIPSVLWTHRAPFHLRPLYMLFLCPQCSPLSTFPPNDPVHPLDTYQPTRFPFYMSYCILILYICCVPCLSLQICICIIIWFASFSWVLLNIYSKANPCIWHIVGTHMWAATNSDICLNMYNDHDKTHAPSSKCSMPTGLTGGMALIPTSRCISSTRRPAEDYQVSFQPTLRKPGQKE